MPLNPTTQIQLRSAVFGLILSTAFGLSSPAATEKELLGAVNSVGPEGKGHELARRAWSELAKGTANSLLPIFEGFTTTNDLAANWLRSVIETIAEREFKNGGIFPIEQLEHFALDRTRSAKARRLAYELVARLDPARSEKIIAGMLNDPGAELRRDAVERELMKARSAQAAGNTNEAKLAFSKLLPQARDVDQIEEVVKTLRQFGEQVDVAGSFGFVTRWKVLGPFDNTGGSGFAETYPPEKAVDLQAEYNGKSGPVRWQDFVSKEDYGEVSMNLPFKHLKAVTAYAVTDFYAAKEMPVELRLGSQNAFKVWLNGQFLFGQNEYHQLKEIDQYTMPAVLRQGRNEILVKVCQNEQTETWADDWDFQLRICDLSGAALRSVKGGAQ